MNRVQAAIRNIVGQALKAGITEMQIISILETTKLDVYQTMLKAEEASKMAIIPASGVDAARIIGGGK